VLFTDGLPDALNARDERLGERSILELLSRMRHNETPDAMLSQVVQLVEQHVVGMPLRDDLAAVIVDRPA
jgi:serine phosphatase RsbU (regulator of sigma subunit)